MDAFVPKDRMIGPAETYGGPEDLPCLYEFLQHVRHVSIRPKLDPSIGPNDSKASQSSVGCQESVCRDCPGDLFAV